MHENGKRWNKFVFLRAFVYLRAIISKRYDYSIQSMRSVW